MKKVEKKLSDNEFLVKYNRNQRCSVKLAKAYEGYTMEETIDGLVSLENQIDNEMYKHKTEKSKIATRLIIDSLVALLGVGVFVLSSALLGPILTFLNVFNPGEIVLYQYAVSAILSVIYEFEANDFRKKQDKHAFKFIQNIKNYNISKDNIEHVKKEYQRLLKMKRTLGYQERLVSPSELMTITSPEEYEKSSNKSTKSLDEPSYSYSFDEKKQSSRTYDYDTSEESKGHRR